MSISEEVTQFATNAGEMLDLLGILVILAGFVFSTLFVTVKAFRPKDDESLYRVYRSSLARSILLGLEFLVAGDIIRTVAGQLSFRGVLVLSIVVLIRTLLGLEFQVEIDGKWPWQRARTKAK